MPTPTKGPRLGGSPAHERLMLANLATSLFRHGKITTTETKAKRLRPLAERMITFAKRGDLHSRRQVLTVVKDKDVVYTLFDQIAPRYTERPGGYTRIIKTGPRKGDAAPMAIIELVEETATAAPAKATRAAAAKATARKAVRTDAVAALAGEEEEETTVVSSGGAVDTTQIETVEVDVLSETEDEIVVEETHKTVTVTKVEDEES